MLTTKVGHFARSSKQENDRSGPYILDTLALGGTKREKGAENDDFDVDACTTKNDKKALLKRARRKYMTSAYIGALVDAAKRNEESSLQKPYWNTYHCARVLTLRSDGKLSGRYCKNRWCLVCNSIRTAQLINRYRPELESWPEKHFVTLTIPNVEAAHLAESLTVMNETFKTIRERLKKRNQRGQSSKFIGIKKLECTYNAERNDFHPHYHFIIKDRSSAYDLLEGWLQTYNACFHSAIWGKATAAAQDVRRANDKSTLELFKYFTKVVQKPNKDGKRLIYADAMDVIFNAVKGKQTFKHFGFPAPVIEADAEQVTEGEVYAMMEYTWNKSDWSSEQIAVDYETGEVIETTDNLTGYVPGEAVQAMAESVVIRDGHTWKKTGYIEPTKPHEPKPIKAKRQRERIAAKQLEIKTDGL